MNQNLQYFQAYCELNALPFDQSWLAIAEQINKQEKNLYSLSRWSYLFEWFNEYCSWAIDLETFMTIGDGINPTKIKQSPLFNTSIQEIVIHLWMDENFWKSQLFVVDERATHWYTLDDLRNKLAKRGSQLYVVSMGVWVQGDDE